MKYVKKYWIPVVLVIAFVAATIYTTRTPYPIEAGALDAWVAQHQDGHRETLAVDALDSAWLAEYLAAEDDLEVYLYRFEADGALYHDILVLQHNDQGQCRLVYESCISQAAVDEGSATLEVTFQVGLYQYTFQVVDGQLVETARALSLQGPILAVVLVVGYLVLMVYTLYYRKTHPDKKSKKSED
jgi:hypothetical protein